MDEKSMKQEGRRRGPGTWS